MPTSNHRADGRGQWIATLAATYFAYYVARFFFTYLPRHLVDVGLTAASAGLALSLSAVVRSAAMPVWGHLSDRHGLGSKAVKLQFGLGLVAFAALPFARGELAVFAALVGLGLTVDGVIPLLDTLTVKALRPTAFGRIRAAGSGGYGVAAGVAALLGSGWLAAEAMSHADIASLAPWFIAGGFGAATLAALAMPRSRGGVRGPELRLALRALSRPILLGLVPIWMLHWASQQPYNLFLVFLCEEKELGAWLPGAAVATGMIAEIAVLAMGEGLSKRLRPMTLLTLSVLATGVRWLLSAWTSDPWVLLGLQALHGLSFGGYLLAVMAVLDREVPGEVRATGQAMLYVLVFGAGSALGSAASGWVVERWSARVLFAGAGWMELGLAAICALIALGVRGRGASAPP